MAAIDPTTISALRAEQNIESPVLTYDRTGPSATYTYRFYTNVAPSDLYGTLGWVAGASHWAASSGVWPFSLIRLSRFDIRRDTQQDEFKTVTVEFDYDQGQQVNDFGEFWRYDFQTEQVQITNVSTAAKQEHYPAAEDTGTAIGVSGNTIDGVSAYRPKMSVNVRKVFSGYPTTTYIDNLRNLQGKVNSSQFDIFPGGSVLFVGASLFKNSNGFWEVSYDFLVAQDLGTQAIEVWSPSGGVVTQSISPEPWEYVWFRYANDPQSGVVTTRIRSVHIAQIYDEASFAPLGLVGNFS